MEGKDVENVMFNFIQGDYDVLVATTIIESGLDIPNVNTIIINEADHFGLSELHQLRGRVGRSNRKAFCYLLAPPLNTLTPEARRRLKAIEEFTELGSGFNIAMQDLDIRGSGNLLGGEQSGFIADVGFETYQRILNEAMQELREEGYSEEETTDFEPQTTGKPAKEAETEGKPLPAQMEEREYVKDFQIDTDMEIMFPDEYISNISERIRLYKELNEIKTGDDLIKYQQRLSDRFGALPPQAVALLGIVNTKWLASKLGIEKILLKNGVLIGYFVSDPNSFFYKTSLFIAIMNYINSHHKNMSIRQKENRLSLTIRNINSVEEANKVLDTIIKETRNRQIMP